VLFLGEIRNKLDILMGKVGFPHQNRGSGSVPNNKIALRDAASAEPNDEKATGCALGHYAQGDLLISKPFRTYF
jgi:hypothetical protein